MRSADTTKRRSITTNMMGTFKGLDYFKWAKEMDVISWDNYPAYDTPWSLVAMRHDLMRGLKDEPFMLMEQTPSQQNWQPYNSLKRPGQMRAQSYQTHGTRCGYDPVLPASSKRRRMRKIPRSSHCPCRNRKHKSIPRGEAAW